MHVVFKVHYLDYANCALQECDIVKQDFHTPTGMSRHRIY